MEVVDAPATLSPEAVLPDDSFFAVTELPSARALLGWSSEKATARQAVLHVSRSGQAWTLDTVAVLDRAGVLRRNVGPGRIELVEVTVGGDTVWHRSVVLPVVPLSPERRDEAIERFAQQAMAASQRTGDPLTPAVARELAEGAVYLPDHLPAVAVVPTTFGEVWILTAESARGPNACVGRSGGSGHRCRACDRPAAGRALRRRLAARG